MDGIPRILQDFLNYMETIRGKSPNTIREYRYDLRLFLKFIKHHRRDNGTNLEDIDISDVDESLLQEVTLSDLYSFISYAGRDRENSASTRARKVASLRSFFNYLTNKAKVLEVNPASELESPKILKKLPRYLNIEESKRLLKSVRGNNRERDYAILTLFLNCGLRLSELVSININNFKNDTLVIKGKGGKERTVYLNDACIRAINAYLRVRPKDAVKDRNALFLSERKQRISPKTIQYIVKKYIKSAGLDPERYSTHKLRHTAATLMYRHGNVDIRTLQQILGHESISTTEIYTHVDNERLRKAVDSNPLADIQD